MNGTPTHLLIAYDPKFLTGLDRIAPCNKCATGQIIDCDHFLEPTPTYQQVDCPLCGKASVRTRPRVRLHIPILLP